MNKADIHTTSQPFLLLKFKDYMQMMKPNLSFMIAFSSIIGYLMVPGVSFNWSTILLLFLGGMLVTNASNIINQILERYSDQKMKRTQSRPLPDQRMTVTEAWIATIVSVIGGVFILTYFFNPLTGILSIISLVLYAFAYTPMKKVHPIATFIGAIPGALPPLIGWVAGSNSLFADTDIIGWVLFGVQFFWQFPHFWAIAWLGYEEYAKAGIFMLPSRDGKTSFTGLQCMFYSLPLIPIVTLPYFLGKSGQIGMIVAVLFSILFLVMSTLFYLSNTNTSAKRLLYSSFLYLPGVLLAIVIDKI